MGGWLRSLCLAQYADAFVARSMDGARLLGLTEQAMEDEPGVGERFTLLAELDMITRVFSSLPAA